MNQRIEMSKTLMKWLIALLALYFVFVGFGRYKIVTFIMNNRVPERLSPLNVIQASLEKSANPKSENELLDELKSESNDNKREAIAIKLCLLKNKHNNTRNLTAFDWAYLPFMSDRLFDELAIELHHGIPWEKLAYAK